ncbi:MAG: type I restriction-modification system endonuclease, partial [Treponema sp.]|nr:type I restriction-modification system endonuclease [Treponema sp.]MCL2252732.1 type I restriction-modification system endonuclease [Treponema sp.]
MIKLRNEGILAPEICDIINLLKTKRSDADCNVLIGLAYTLAKWFVNVNEAEYKNFTAVAARAIKYANNLNLSEKETRFIIDDQLRKVGWEVDSENLKYDKGTRPQIGKNMAIAEWPTDSVVCKFGKADYALFIDLHLVGIVEAKAANKDVSAVIDNQCREYSIGIRKEDASFLIDTWGDYKVPFLFATNGRRYQKQYETKSGIWFRDVRIDTNIPKALQGWISPEGLRDMLEKDINNANIELCNTSYDLLRDNDGLNLRPYQIEAIEKAEAAIVQGRQTVLLAMATGTGKTRTVLGMIYRFLESKRFKRILFLVDRNTLGEQAQDVFHDVRNEDLMPIDKIYEVKKLEDKAIEKETKIHVATVQSLVKRILYNDEDSMPAVTDYDLIIIDEAHRGYILDKEMSDDEQLYRDQLDFISKYRTVIEYFDAVKVALTATPALHTTNIFGEPVFNYNYRRAVVEGYLVDHDAPHEIKTKLRNEGITYKQGETIAILDPISGEITNNAVLEDELKFDIENFNRQVITENFNRTVFEEITQYINPEGEGKTLIYAVDDDHADLIVKIIREIYKEKGIPSDAIMKITGSVGGGNPKKVSEVVKRFKNETHPNIAVTVDLLTTGIDVPEITTLVFMRRVKSRILFEQMLGRATRLCPEINKTHFEIYDPVGVYESILPMSDMKPVAPNESATFTDLLKGLEVLDTDQKIKNQIYMIIAKIQRRKRRLTDMAKSKFIYQSGGLDPSQFIEKLSKLKTDEAKELLLNCAELFNILEEGKLPSDEVKVVSEKPDEFVSHTRGFGDGKSPQDYLDEFAEFIKNKRNEIKALEVVCTRPRELTRESLKSLKMELDKHCFTDKMLNTAWKELKNEDIGADIISFIRRYALGS